MPEREFPMNALARSPRGVRRKDTPRYPLTRTALVLITGGFVANTWDDSFWWCGARIRACFGVLELADHVAIVLRRLERRRPDDQDRDGSAAQRR